MRTLIILAHPNLDKSVVNHTWLKALEASDLQITVHRLYEAYPNGGPLDVEAEQARVREHDAIVWQFPFYWFSTPPLLKQWQDEVLTHDFAYGHSEGQRQLAGKPIGMAISAGIKQEDYMASGRYHYSLDELLRPLDVTIRYIDAVPVKPWVFYGAEYDIDLPQLEANAQGYVSYLRQLAHAA
ncbi:NAD(P)H-dependent oxidoreductase [Pseudomonas sp. 7P_10.2_Bac1]|uniref:NAD(P)H-dependent oxidoreductase n=1 Tax=Pseudomonas sp. 7P_10.2_Bac1 TaxID=2971614 RepID=UPI0021CA7ED6|nr:NAD(P)H-dependent oxidoreductase [Pseudomonas sp. 7P_10.2_Bac1]MCU1726220.1 NAD(P)H-dependent oxidoreductase [Pseudomonas sp. 7P_10.2_Bac1]